MRPEDQEIITISDAHIVEITGGAADPFFKEKIELARSLKKPIYLIIKQGYDPEQWVQDYLKSIQWDVRATFFTKNGTFNDCKESIQKDFRLQKIYGGC